MDTARIDIERLQLLNARVAQTIEALNQVRMSLHDVSQVGGWPVETFGLGHTTPNVFLNAYDNPYFAQSPWGVPLASVGLGHTPSTSVVSPTVAAFAQLGYSPFAFVPRPY